MQQAHIQTNGQMSSVFLYDIKYDFIINVYQRQSQIAQMIKNSSPLSSNRLKININQA